MMEMKPEKNFVTVISVGQDVEKYNNNSNNNNGFVTMLTIGDDSEEEVIEEVLVYRLPGEQLGFGLKFEGGTKQNEFVERLIILTCARDSPASRVQSSWGKLTVGDEVLEIDSVPVNGMTRNDCVRCLKDSNVVLKLLVKHCNDRKTRSVEDLPQVVSAEKKRTPPPPPPVPPRKTPRKLPRQSKDIKESTPPKPPARQHHHEINNATPNGTCINNNEKIKKFQSPRSSGRLNKSPDIQNRDRFSDDGPPNAEVYVDLFSGQESTQSLSESDDTGSSISTVIDKFASLPTTTTSSLAGSLPSTPTSTQKQFNLILDDEEKKSPIVEKEDGVPLQPPSCFQDAPLSYGNEEMRIRSQNEKISKKPPVPPRSRDSINKTQEIHDENMNIPNLPRLVDFVPKKNEIAIDKLKEFLENERRDHYDDDDDDDDDDGDDDDVDDEEDDIFGDIDTTDVLKDLFGPNWGLSSQLATIGEVEEVEEANKAPIVIVENCDKDEDFYSKENNEANNDIDVDGNMDGPPSDPRQSPDGHEFPDLEENYPNYIEPVNLNQNRSSFTSANNLTNINNLTNRISNIVLSSSEEEIDNDVVKLRRRTNFDKNNTLHTRSQSLIDMSTYSDQHHSNDRWNELAEQRRRSLSKLKGLVIPEHVGENHEIQPSVNIPEIISQQTTNRPYVIETKIEKVQNTSCHLQEIPPVALPLTLPPWASNNNNTIPKYSPAFKRKGLQLYGISKKSNGNNDAALLNKCDKNEKNDDHNSLSDAPKSLESITSPTKSDYSFDFITPKPITAAQRVKEPIVPPNGNRSLKDTLLGKSEDESDNDSAVSSSQSSYISKFSPPLSPTREMLTDQDIERYSNLQSRLLKPASVEAINRKNILASAKCRSGRDLKVGSPVIQRKYDVDNETKDEIDAPNKPHNHPHHNESKTKVSVPLLLSTPIKSIQPVRSSPYNSSTPAKTNTPKAQSNIEEIKKRLGIEHFDSKTQPLSATTNLLQSKQRASSVIDLRKNFEKDELISPKFPKPLVPIKTEPIKNNKILPGNNSDKMKKNETEKPEPVKIYNENTNNVDKEKINGFGNAKTVILCPKFVGGSVGVTLAGGTDQESKEITVHRIRYGSVAYIDGRLKRGDRIISINGTTTCNLTHAESVELLKEHVAKFALIVEECKEEPLLCPQRKSTFLKPPSPTPSNPVKNVTNVVTLVKDGAGLGFSIEGGKDSPQGDLPLRIKKIFQGGNASKTSELQVADELLAINDVSLTNMSKMEVWSLMKKLPDGNVSIHIHR